MESINVLKDSMKDFDRKEEMATRCNPQGRIGWPVGSGVRDLPTDPPPELDRTLAQWRKSCWRTRRTSDTQRTSLHPQTLPCPPTLAPTMSSTMASLCTL